MSEIVGMVGMSHSPFATMLAPPAPDAAVVIGPDHFHGNFYDAMAPFVPGVGEAEAFGDFGSRSGPLPVAADLAWAVRDGLARDGFDIALSYALTVDHGIAQSYDMVRGRADFPLVPLVVNTAAPPLPSMGRCLALGRALGATLRAAGAGRESRVRDLGGNPDARVNAAWDTWFLKQLTAADRTRSPSWATRAWRSGRAAAATRSAPGSPPSPRPAGR